MTANKRVTGADNEQRATEYLIDNGYSILERNFRNKTGEIDIIAQNDNLIVFVEVKYRSSSRNGDPGESITAAKQRRIRMAAEWYCMEKGLSDCPCRFDAVLITGSRYCLIRNAF